MESREAQEGDSPRQLCIVRFHRGPIYKTALLTAFTLAVMLIVNSYSDISSFVKKSEDLTARVEAKQDLPVSDISMESDIAELKKKNDDISEELQKTRQELARLTEKNRELAEDNIALQNSLKMAAASGIKPQNYTRFDGLESRGSLDRGKYIGKFLGTAYTPSKDECGNNKGITNSGKPIVPGITIAVDKKYWPFGTVFYIKGLGYAVAMDTGSAIKGKYRFDFSVFDKKFAAMLGSRQWEVYLIRMGKGYVEDMGF